MNTISIGIDFGTTKTIVSWYNPERGQAELLRLGRSSELVPTTVYVGSNGSMQFGDDADDCAEDEGGRYLRGFKMHLGNSKLLHMYPAADGRMRMLTAKDLTTEFLSYIRKKAQDEVFMGKPISKAVITRPVKFSPAQLEELRQAALEAGFAEVEFTTEPEAAGIAFCRMCPQQAFKGNALVVDWGGGTLDIALVTRSGDTIKTHPNYLGGDMTMGGEVFDERLWMYVSLQLQANNDSADELRMLKEVRKAKERLSQIESLTLRLSGAHGVCKPINVERTLFNCCIATDVDKAAAMVQEILTPLKQTEFEPEMLLLVGGSSNVPLISQKLEEVCGLPARKWQFSREAVALGASLKNKVLQPNSPKAVETTPPPVDATPPPIPTENQPAPAETSAHFDVAMQLYLADSTDPAMVQNFKDGYAAGDVNCTFMLAWCACDGYSCECDVRAVYRYACELDKVGCPLSHDLMSQCYSCGYGCSIDADVAQQHSRAFLQKTEQPVPGVNDDLRLMIRALHVLGCDYLNNTEKLRYYREYACNSSHPCRYSLAARGLISLYNQESFVKEELMQMLDLAQKVNDKNLHAAKCMCELVGVHGELKAERLKGHVDRYLAKSNHPEAEIVWISAILASEEDYQIRALKKFWSICQYGSSGIVPRQSLPCSLSLMKPSVSAIYCVYDRSVCVSLLQSEKVDEMIVSPILPDLVIKNNANVPLNNLSVRICIENKEDKVFPLKSGVQPGQEMGIALSDFDITYTDDFAVEVQSSDNSYTRMDLRNLGGLSTFVGNNPPPLIMFWEKSFFGGYVLKIKSFSGEVTHLMVRKQNGAYAECERAKENEEASFGWAEFSDSGGLEENEIFFVTCDQGDAVIGKILTTPEDSSKAGWLKAAGVIGSLAAGVVLGS